MNNPVLILYLEDNPRDAELVRDKLQQSRMACELRVASDRAEYEAALAQTRFDLILSDYSLPDYDGMAALAWARAKQPDVPCVIVSGTLGDEQAVDCVLRGATDYVLKQQLDRLVPAVLRALTEAEERRKRREAEESLCASEVRYRRLFEAAKDGILILDAETGMVVDVNPFLIELLGYSRETLLGKKIWELGLFKDVFANQDHFAELQQREYVRYQDKPLATSDGRRVEVEFISNVYRVNDYKVIQCNIRDISERKRAEEELRSARAFLGDVVNAIADPVFVKDDERRFVLVNDALCAIVGRSRECLLGENGDDMFPEDQVAVFRQMDDRVLDTGEENTNEETLSDLSSGQVRTIITRKTRHIDRAGKRFLVGVIRDITERKRAEEALERNRAQLLHAQKIEAVGRLAGGMAHDFNNILQAMLSQAQALQLGAESPGLAEAVAEIEAHIRRGASLTQQLLLFSRRQVSQRKRVDLGEVVGAGTSMLRRLIPENIRLAVEIAPRRLWVEGDNSQLQQALVNLALNARDAMPSGGALSIRADSGEGEVVVEVTDTGHGMDEEARAHLFEPFFTTKEAGHGTGLGLAVVHGIVEQHGGRIEVRSRPGEGSRFRVVLPAAPEQPVTAGSLAQAAVELPRGQGERVLLVEDEDGARKGLAKILTVLGYQATAVGSGEEALALEDTPGFDLLLSDLMLPGIAGDELAGRLGERWPALKVVLMSGYTEDQDLRRGVEQRAMRFLQKPFDMAALAREVRAALGDAG